MIGVPGRAGHAGRELLRGGSPGPADRDGHRAYRLLLGRLLRRPSDSLAVGIWSSDRVVGCRRIAVQPLLALVAGLAALAAVLLLGPRRSWPVASAALAAYTLGRQFLLGLRADPPRRPPHGGQVTVIAAAAALIASIVILARGAA